MQKLFKSLIKSDYEKFFHKHRALWDLSVPLTLQSRWRIERFSFKSILTWNYLFSIYFIKKLELDSLHSFHSFRSRWRVRKHFFAKYSDMNYFVLYATFNKVMASFITLTLQSKWRVRSFSLQSIMTWIILFYTQCFKYYVMGILFVSIVFIKIIWILFTFNV